MVRVRLHKAQWWNKYWKVCKDPNCGYSMHIDADLPGGAIKHIPELGEDVVAEEDLETLKVSV